MEQSCSVVAVRILVRVCDESGTVKWYYLQVWCYLCCSCYLCDAPSFHSAIMVNLAVLGEMQLSKYYLLDSQFLAIFAIRDCF